MKIAKDVSEASEVLAPLKAACGVMVTILEVIKTVQRNKRDWLELRVTISEHLRVFEEQIRHLEVEDAIHNSDSPLLAPIQSYGRALKELVSDLDQERGVPGSAKGSVVGSLKASFKKISGEEAARIAGYRSALDMAKDTLIQSLSVYMAYKVEKIETRVIQIDRKLNLQQAGKKVSPLGHQHTRCLEGTRIEPLHMIDDWSKNPRATSRIWCLRDVAGIGKSTVATEVAHKWNNENRLAARFFFSRGTSGTATAIDFCSYIADALITRYPQIKYIISNKLNDPNIHSEPVKKQWKELVSDPLSTMSLPVPHMLVVDALDECDETRTELLSCMVDTFGPSSTAATSFRLFLTMRPEGALNIEGKAVISGLQQTQGQRNNNIMDVQSYIHHELTRLEDDSVTKEMERELIAHAGGSFIYAATVCKVLEQSWDRAETLGSLLGSKSFHNLDGLYSSILARVIPNDSGSRRAASDVLALILAAQETLHLKSIVELFPGSRSVQRVVKGLGSVLSSGEMDDYVYILHPTFREFLLRERHSSEFIVDIHIGHKLLVEGSLAMLRQSLRFDICNVIQQDDRIPLDEEINDLDGRIKQNVAPTLRYAAVHWLLHLMEVLQLEDISSSAVKFFQDQLLHWLELVGLFKMIGRSTFLLGQVHQTVKEINKVPSSNLNLLDEWCSEIISLLRSNQSILHISYLQIYMSALVFVPPNSLIGHQCRSCSPLPLPRVFGKIQRAPEIMISVGSSELRCIDYAPDGHRIAAGFDDGYIKVWDVYTGGLLHNFVGHQEIWCMKFSPDGKWLLSGSSRGSLQRSDWQIGLQEEGLWNLGNLVACMEFMPDGKTLICGLGEGLSGPGSLCAVDIISGQKLWDIKNVHQSRISSICFSTAGEYMATASLDTTLRIWTPPTTRIAPNPLRTIHHTNQIFDAAFLPNSTYVSTAARELYLWDVARGEQLFCQRVDGYISSLAVSSLGDKIVTDGAHVHIWNARDGLILGELDNYASHIVYAPNEGSFAFNSRDVIHIRDPNVHTSTPQSTGAAISSLSFSNDGKWVAAAHDDMTLSLWEANSTELKAGPWGTSHHTSKIILYPGGEHVICVDEGKFNIWNMWNGQHIRQFADKTKKFNLAAFSPNGQLLALHHDYTFTLWDARRTMSSGISLIIQLDHGGWHDGPLAFHPSGRYLVHGDDLWDVTKSPPQKILPRIEGLIEETLPNWVYQDIFKNIHWIDVGNPLRQSIAFPPEFDTHVIAINGSKVALALPGGGLIILDSSPILSARLPSPAANSTAVRSREIYSL